MATYTNGILGGFSGKVGPIVGYQLRDKNVLRSLPTKTNLPPSVQQLNQRNKFGFVNSFLSPLFWLISQTFTQLDAEKSVRGTAISYYLAHCVYKTEDGFAMHYPKMLVSTGPLRGLQNATLQSVADKTLLVQWQDNSTQAFAAPTHLLTLVLYAPALHEFFFVENAAQRDAQQLEVPIPTLLQDEPLQVWGFFSALQENGTLAQIATSDYLGAIVIV